MERLRTFLRTLLVRPRIIGQPDILVCLVADHPAPKAMEPGRLYVVGSKRYQKWAYLRCPADTQEILQLSLMANHRPRWQVTIDWLGRPTVNPSVRQLDGSYAHFWVKKGKIEWCADSGVKPQFLHALEA